MKVLRFFLLTVTYLAYSISSLGAPLAKDAKIAIIGAGASGLTAAYELEQKGYTRVTVFEKESRVGGKVFSTSEGGRKFELGAIWAGEKYPTVDAYAEHFGVKLEAEMVSLDVQSQAGQVYSITDYPLAKYPLWKLVHNYFAWRKVQQTFGYLRETGSFLLPIHPDLSLNFAEFMKKYHIEAFAESYRPFWVACGYGYYEEVPALYVLKLMLEGLDITFGDLLRQTLHIDSALSSPLRFAPEGFQEIWIRLAAELNDLRLNQAVEKVTRRQTPEGFAIEVSTTTQTESFDALIISTDPRIALGFMDFSPSERALFNQVRSYRYILHLFEGEALRAKPESLTFFDRHGTPDQIGHVIAMLRREAEPPLWTSLQFLPWDQPIENASNVLVNDLSELGLSMGTLHRRIEWNYFPHVDSAALSSGFFTKAAELQGKNGTYYVGGLWNFETVEGTASFAQQLVHKYF